MAGRPEGGVRACVSEIALLLTFERHDSPMALDSASGISSQRFSGIFINFELSMIVSFTLTVI
jgi:hypothetical protein